MKTIFRLLLAVALMSTFLYADLESDMLANGRIFYGIVTKVVDGDTVHIKAIGKEYKCRVAYVDTPEKRKNKKYERDVGNCGYLAREEMAKAGRLATEYAKKKLPVGKKVSFEILDKDRYGRVICVIKNPGPRSDYYNYTVVADGYAVPYYRYLKDDDELSRRIEDSLSEAMRSRAGLWRVAPNAMMCLLRSREEIGARR